MKFNLESVLLLVIPMINPLAEQVKKDHPDLSEDAMVDEIMGDLKHALRKKLGAVVDLLWLTDMDEKVAQVVRIMV